MKILLGITGSMFAYKAIGLAKELIRNMYDVEIVLTKSAEKFISTLTLQGLFPGKVYTEADIIDKNYRLLNRALAEDIDLVLIAPATANTIGCLAKGISNSLLLQICLSTEAPILLAPSTQTGMWENCLIQNNIRSLIEVGVHIIGPSFGVLAYGDYGMGRMLGIKEIVDEVNNYVTPKILNGKKIVITSGPTREKIDPSRFISDYCSGKVGQELAKIAMYMGADVTLVRGPNYNKAPHKKIKVIDVESANEMYKAVSEHITDADIFIGGSMVSDYRPATCMPQKIKKSSDTLELKLVRNVDIIEQIKQNYPKTFCVGFALETENIEENARNKLKNKKLDLVTICDSSNSSLHEIEFSELKLISKDQKAFNLPRASKENIAKNLLTIISNLISTS